MKFCVLLSSLLLIVKTINKNMIRIYFVFTRYAGKKRNDPISLELKYINIYILKYIFLKYCHIYDNT